MGKKWETLNVITQLTCTLVGGKQEQIGAGLQKMSRKN